jgi:conjugal transfer/type IV secretion protein DotA/TraY
MRKYFLILMLITMAVHAPYSGAQTTPEPKNEKIGEIIQNADPETVDRSGLNALNIPVDGLNGPDDKDLGWSMLQYILGSVSVEVYNKVFDNTQSNPNASGVVTGTTLLLAIMSGIGLMMLYTVMFYVVLFGLLFSNVSGKPFGERWSTPHLAIRSFLSLTLLQPMARYSGLNGGQVIILALALSSMGFAGAIFRQINSTMLTTPIVHYAIKDLDSLFLQLNSSHMCQVSLAASNIVKLETPYESEERFTPLKGVYSFFSELLWDKPDDQKKFNQERNSYCVGPECVCGKFVIDIPKLDNSEMNAAKWEKMQVSDFYGDWITQYMYIQGARHFNDVVNNYLDLNNSPFNASSKVILDYVNDPEKSKNITDLSGAATDIREAYRKELDIAWSKFKEQSYKFLDDDKISVQQIKLINEKMAGILSDTGFVTAGFAHYIWMQRQEKLSDVYSTVVHKSFETKIGPQYLDNEYLEELDLEGNLAFMVSYPIDLHKQLVTDLSYRGMLPSDFSELLMSAAKGETEDSAIGALFNSLSTSTQEILFAIPRGSLSAESKDYPDPVMEMKAMGDAIFTTVFYGGAIMSIAQYFGKTDSLGKLKGLFGGQKDGGFLSFALASIFAALLGIAFTYSFVIPSIPFVMFTLGVAAYFAYLFAVLGGSPVWIATWGLPDGHDVFGHGGAGWSMVATLMLKPTFMLIGLVVGSAIIKTMGFFVNSTFLPTMLAMNSGVNPIHIIGNMTIYATLMSVLVYKSYALIFELGELIFAMIGVNGQHATFFKASEGSQALTGLNTVAASRVGNATKDAVGAMLKYKSRQAKSAT